MEESREKLAKKIWSDYERGLAYQKKLNLKETCEACVKFAEGDQWPAPTEKTKNMPRPVLNIIKFIINNKKANILSSKISMIFKPMLYTDEKNEKQVSEMASTFTNFANHIKKEIKQEDLDELAITDGLRKGTYIYHYYWDKELKSGIARYDGGMNGQIIDPLNIVFANPCEKDEQKQRWIIIQGRENVKSLKELGKKNGLSTTELELITPDVEQDKNYDVEEQDGEEYATVLIKYFRENGEVYYTKSTKNIIVQKETPLTPNAEDITIKVKEDGDTTEDLEELPQDKPTNTGYKMTLYPIAVGNHESREKSIYGIGEVEQIIPAQKAININYAMVLMGVQNIGFPKMAIRPQALHGQKITNSPGEILTDYSQNFNGIKYIQPPAFSSMPLTVTDKLFETVRTITGATEVASGEVLGANMSGSAIVALQSQAKVPIEDIQKRFWRVHEKIAKIWEQFFKAYYTFDYEFLIENEDNTSVDKFNGQKYQNVEFTTAIDVGPGSAYSESMSIALLENALNAQHIDFDQFIELYPDNAMPFKAKLKEMRKKQLLPAEISEQIASNPQVLQYVMQILQQAQTPAQQNDITR